jgi:hypothetical protein
VRFWQPFLFFLFCPFLSFLPYLAPCLLENRSSTLVQYPPVVPSFDKSFAQRLIGNTSHAENANNHTALFNPKGKASFSSYTTNAQMATSYRNRGFKKTIVSLRKGLSLPPLVQQQIKRLDSLDNKRTKGIKRRSITKMRDIAAKRKKKEEDRKARAEAAKGFDIFRNPLHPIAKSATAGSSHAYPKQKKSSSSSSATGKIKLTKQIKKQLVQSGQLEGMWVCPGCQQAFGKTGASAHKKKCTKFCHLNGMIPVQGKVRKKQKLAHLSSAASPFSSSSISSIVAESSSISSSSSVSSSLSSSSTPSPTDFSFAVERPLSTRQRKRPRYFLDNDDN